MMMCIGQPYLTHMRGNLEASCIGSAGTALARLECFQKQVPKLTTDPTAKI